MFYSKKVIRDFSLRRALVCWYKKVLLAEPPPLAIIRKLYSDPLVPKISIYAGKLDFVLASANMD